MRIQYVKLRWLMMAVAAAVMAGAAVMALPETTHAMAQTAVQLVNDTGMSGPRMPRDRAPDDAPAPRQASDLRQTQQAFYTFIRDRLQAAYEQAVSDAVAEGVVTQEQADLFTQAPGWLRPSAPDANAEDAPAGDAPGDMRMHPDGKRWGDMMPPGTDDGDGDAPAGDAPRGMRMRPPAPDADMENTPEDEMPDEMPMRMMPRGGMHPWYTPPGFDGENAPADAAPDEMPLPPRGDWHP